MMSFQSFTKEIQSNWKSGLTVALVSIPLSISLAVASGVSPVAGIITGVWAGLIASLFAGSNYNIIGPTGALSGLVASYALAHGAQTVSLLAILVGLFILLAYSFKLERYLVFVPSSVIHGFTLGVAFIIGLNQLNYALGLQGLPRHEKFITNVIESFKNISHLSFGTFLTFIIFFVSLEIWRNMRLRIPGAIVMAPLGILVGYLASIKALPLTLETLGSKFGTMQATLMQFPELQWTKLPLISAVVIALVAIIETMLSAKIADSMTKTKHNPRKEMFALGLANIGSGLMGGIPATAALARTAFNIKNGATSKLSATLSSIFMACCALLFLHYFTFIPMAVIAALLVNVAVNMIERQHFQRLFKLDKTSFGIAMLVAFITIYEDPIIGILVGTVISLLLFIGKLSEGYYEIRIHDGKSENITPGQLSTPQGKTLVYSIKGKLVYLNSHAHIARFEENLKDYNFIILRLRGVYFIDLDGVDALDEIIHMIHQRGQLVLISRVPEQIKALLHTASKEFKALDSEGLVFETTGKALDYIKTKF